MSKGNQIFKSITSVTIANNTSGSIKIGTIAADNFWEASIDAAETNLSTSAEISSELLNKIRQQSPTSKLEGSVISNIPAEDSKLDVIFEGQKYTIKVEAEELIVDGPEQNRVKAIFEETSNTIQNSIALSQQGSANTNLTLNGINSSTTFSGTKISISSLGDETLNSFTVSGTI